MNNDNSIEAVSAHEGSGDRKQRTNALGKFVLVSRSSNIVRSCPDSPFK